MSLLAQNKGQYQSKEICCINAHLVAAIILGFAFKSLF